MSLVRIISSRVLFFSVSYIIAEKYNSRFFILVLLFIFSIYLLILSPNLISLLLGWDGLGVTSYLLVIFYQRNKSWNAGILTAITNRIGDVGLLIRISIIVIYGHWRYLIQSYFSIPLRNIFIAIIIISACTKRAQIPFSAWLPAAIAAPTPVSSLVHSSTLVTAGVYLLIRFNVIFQDSTYVKVLYLVSISTIIIAGVSAIFEDDIKKIVALSTLSQLGVIIIALGANKPILAYFHLILHAYFKAILFMCAGFTIHAIKDYQDIRTMGISESIIPFVINIVLVCNMSLCGLPFMRGFYSKDIILEYVILQNNRLIIIVIIIVSTLLTMAYSMRIRLILGLNNSISEPIVLKNVIDLFIFGGIILLYPFAVFGGYVVRWNIVVCPQIVYMPIWIKIIILISLIGGTIVTWILFNRSNFLSLSKTLNLIKNIFYIPYTFRPVILNLSLSTGKNFWKSSERIWIEFLYFKNLFIQIKNFLNPINFFVINYYLSSIFILIFIIVVFIW